MEIDLHWGQTHRRIVLLVILVLVTAAAVALLRPHLPALQTAQEERVAQEVVRDYLNGVLTPDDPRITGRMAEDVARLAELPHGEFISFEKKPHVIVLSPEDEPTRARLVGSARYRSPAGKVFLGEITVEMIRGEDGWKVDRILVRPLVNVEP